MKTSEKKIFVFGATGFVGQQLHHCGTLSNVMWFGRSHSSLSQYVRLDSYAPESLTPWLEQAGTIIWLPARTRDRRAKLLEQDNTALPLQVGKLLAAMNRPPRMVFFSTDLADCSFSPYGVSKQRAEKALLGLGIKVVCLRASMIAGTGKLGLPSSLKSMKRLAQLPLVPLIGDGSFLIRPLSVADIARVISILHACEDNAFPTGVFRMEGQDICFRDALRLLAVPRKSRQIVVPFACYRLAGRILTSLNPQSGFPYDFMRSCTMPHTNIPESIFARLGIEPQAPEQVLQLV